jgi:hypothetical protein
MMPVVEKKDERRYFDSKKDQKGKNEKKEEKIQEETNKDAKAPEPTDEQIKSVIKTAERSLGIDTESLRLSAQNHINQFLEKMFPLFMIRSINDALVKAGIVIKGDLQIDYFTNILDLLKNEKNSAETRIQERKESIKPEEYETDLDIQLNTYSIEVIDKKIMEIQDQLEKIKNERNNDELKYNGIKDLKKD